MVSSIFPTVLLFTSAFITYSTAAPPNGELRSRASSSGCGKATPECKTPDGVSGSCYIKDFTSNKVTRKFLYHVPKAYDSSTPAPLIFSFHGHGKNAKNQELLSQFSNEAADYNPNAIAVYPDGLTTTDSPDAQGWQGDHRHNSTDDLGFVTDMIAHFESNFCIDTSRIYATGKSNGGGFTGNVLACDPVLSKVIAAFAPVAGAYYIGSKKAECDTPEQRQTIPIPCSPGRTPIPLLEFHGGADETANYSGKWRNEACLPTVPHFIREWSKRDGLGLTNKTTNSNSNLVHKYEYGSGANLGILTHIKIDTMEHWWPSTSPNSDSGPNNHTLIEATPIIMSFFKKWSL